MKLNIVVSSNKKSFCVSVTPLIEGIVKNLYANILRLHFKLHKLYKTHLPFQITSFIIVLVIKEDLRA